MNKLAEFAILSYGQKRALLLIFFGAIAALSVPPLFILPAIFIAFPVWVWCLDGAEKKSGYKKIFAPSFTIGWYFGFGYFLLSLHWIGAAFFVDGGWIIALMPLAIIILAGFLAIFWAFASFFAHIFWSDNFLRIIALALFVSLFEYLRSFLFTGFPFNQIGYALTLNDQFAQLSAFIGINGMNFLALFLAMLPALIWPKSTQNILIRFLPASFIIIILAGQFLFGQYRIANTVLLERNDVKLRLVQPAIDQSQKWQANNQTMIMEKLFSLSQTKLSLTDAGINGVTYIIWPEAAIPFYLSDYPSYLAQIAVMLPLGKSLITGAPRKEFADKDGEKKSYNSIFIINSSGEIIDAYDKTHLVPFAEYLPFRSFFAKLGIKQFVPGNDGWFAGSKRKILQSPGAPSFLPLICYEAVFSGQLGEQIKQADFILNLTNDSWFDGSIGPLQHFYHARVRAIEEGKSLVRVANSGITALINPLGQIEASLKQGEAAILDIFPINPIKETFFAKYKNKPFLIFSLFLLIILSLQKIFLYNKKL